MKLFTTMLVIFLFTAQKFDVKKKKIVSEKHAREIQEI